LLRFGPRPRPSRPHFAKPLGVVHPTPCSCVAHGSTKASHVPNDVFLHVAFSFVF
jgi:hypothetical protein